MIPKLAVIITASGSSSRFSEKLDKKIKKEYLSIDGHTVLYRATKPFLELPSISALIVTYPEGCEDETAVALEDIIDIATIPILLVKGGMTRKESVRLALEKLKTVPVEFDYIAIHDGARPYIDSVTIIQTLATATVLGGAVPALPIADAIKTIAEDGTVGRSVDRKTVFTVQTPQIFKRDELFDAYEQYPSLEADDDVTVFTSAGYKCMFSQGNPQNKKITYLRDIPDAEKQAEEYWEAREKGRKSAAATRRMRELMLKKRG